MRERTEPRGAPACDERIFGKSWNAARRFTLDALGEMGGREAGEVLVNYVRDPRADYLDRAFASLARIDPAAARREAGELLRGPREEELRPLIGGFVE